MNLELPPLHMPPASVADAFLGTAWAFIGAAKCLAVSDGGHDWPGSLLAGHALECGLKAHLARKGWSERRVAKKGHSLKKLWRAARSEGLQISEDLSQWCAALDEIYAWPHLVRYPMEGEDKETGTPAYGFNGISTPPLSALVTEVETIMSHVEACW